MNKIEQMLILSQNKYPDNILDQTVASSWSKHPYHHRTNKDISMKQMLHQPGINVDVTEQ